MPESAFLIDIIKLLARNVEVGKKQAEAHSGSGDTGEFVD